MKKNFPAAKIIICMWRISKCLYTNLRREFGESEVAWTAFSGELECLVLFLKCKSIWRITRNVSEQLQIISKSIEETWLTPYKEYFISTWIDQHMHFGNKASNRVASGHTQIKIDLRFMDISLLESLRMINNAVLHQIDKIKSSFEDSIFRVRHILNLPFYRVD